MIWTYQWWILILITEAGALVCDRYKSKEDSNKHVIQLTQKEQISRLIQAKIQCEEEIAKGDVPNGLFCNKTFDNGLCLPYTAAGNEVYVPCPDYVSGFDKRGRIKIVCLEDGTWKKHSTRNTTKIDFNECVQHSNRSDVNIQISSLIKDHANTIKILYDVGYAVSVASLALAIFLMLAFRKLHCPRNTIHINLFIAFMLRGILCIVKDVHLIPEGNFVMEEGGIIFNSTGPTWHCKLVYVLFHYLLAANYMWIFVEGLYLHTLLYFAMSNKKTVFKCYIVFGWVSPLPLVIAWTLVRLYHADTLCWSMDEEGYYWIIRGPILATICINFLFFVNIIRVLFTKLSAPTRSDPDRHRKLAKSILVLIPLFGVYYVVFIAIPDCVDDRTHVIFLYVESVFSSIQGFIVALLFCFLNSEVRGEIGKLWKNQLMRRQSLASMKSNRTVSMGSSMFFRERSTPGDVRSTTFPDVPEEEGRRRGIDNDNLRPENSTQFESLCESECMTLRDSHDHKDTFSEKENGLCLNSPAGLDVLSASDEDLSETSRML